MTAARDHEELHRLVDRLSPEQVRRLRVLADTDPELHELLDIATAQSPDPPGGEERLLALAGIWGGGPPDAAERHDELIRERLARSS